MTQTARHFEPSWESLQQYECPEWFKNAKLGIFIHWGPYSVPAFGNEWYPRHMYIKDTKEYEYHLKTWGPHKEFGYKDFIPMFKAENWNPSEWLDLFEAAGARYVVPVAEHHDGFPMYDCSYSDWTSVKMGPKRNILAELVPEIRKRGLKVGLSSHRAFNWSFFTFDEEFDTVNPKYSGLYGEIHEPYPLIPGSPYVQETPQRFRDDWLARTKELVDKFHPDLMWFDWCFDGPDFEEERKQFAAYYYNQARKWSEGPVLNYKEEAFKPGTAVWDIERGKLKDMQPYYWQTDTSVSYNSWSYIDNDEFKSVTTLVHDLVDIVSKQGNLLLNVGPKADGTIPAEAVDRFRGLGQWLKVNGEAIYDTRVWERFGEGDTTVEDGWHTEKKNKPFTASDIRFSRNGSTLYAICLGRPEGSVDIHSFGKDSSVKAEAIERISLLGGPESLEYSQNEQGLHVAMPDTVPGEHAYSLKIEMKS